MEFEEGTRTNLSSDASRLQWVHQSVLACLRYICPRLSASVTNCSGLDFFLNLQADTAAPVRRFAAYFLQHLLLFKPGPCISAESTIQEHEISPRFPATLFFIFWKTQAQFVSSVLHCYYFASW